MRGASRRMELASADLLVFAAGALTGAAVLGLVVTIPAYLVVTRLRRRMRERHKELMGVLMGGFEHSGAKLQHMALAQLLARGESGEVDLTGYEGSVSSQNGEDGALLEIFRRIGTANQFFVEIGAQVSEANCLLCADVFAWAGVFFEADEPECDALRRKYAGVPIVQVVGGFVTRDNVNSLMDSAGVPEQIDMMSIDVDGNDYWLLEALDRVRPRVIVIEVNSSLPPGKKWVQPYSDRMWDRQDPSSRWLTTDFYGASLAAMHDLAARKGYRLVHVEVTGNNAFFLREELVGDMFPSESEIRRRAVNNWFRGQTNLPRDPESKFLDLDEDVTSASQPKPR